MNVFLYILLILKTIKMSYQFNQNENSRPIFKSKYR